MNFQKFNEEKQILEDLHQEAELIVLQKHDINLKLFNNYDSFVEEFSESFRDEINEEIGNLRDELVKGYAENYNFEYL